MKPYRLLLFDRDGTLTYENRDYHRQLADLKAYPFTGSLLRDLHQAGHELAVVTNQSGVARGLWPLEEVEAVHQRFCREWGVDLAFYVCPHHPRDGCHCRKPQPELIRQAMAQHQSEPEATLMVGDSPADFGAAQGAGVAFALVLTGRGRLTQAQLPQPPDMVLDSIAHLRAYVV